MNRRNYIIRRIIMMLLILIFLFAAVKFTAGLLEQNRNRKTNPSGNAGNKKASDSWGSRVTYQGKNYHLKDGITSVLFLGIDYGTDAREDVNIGTGGRSDAIMLFILDDAEKTIRTLLIPRDTMTDVDIYRENGEFVFSAFVQINMQYAFGDSRKRSCYLTKRTLSRLLHDLRIGPVLSLDVEGIAPLTDYLGGVELTLTEDYTDIDPSYTKGSRITLTKENAEAFVRQRDTDLSGSALERMKRHFELLKAVFSGHGKKDAEDLLKAADPYVETDLDADTMEKLMQYRFEDTALTLPGDLVPGERHDEYHVNDAKTKQLILELFYEERP